MQSLNITMGAEILHFGLERDQQTFVKALRSHEYKEVQLGNGSWKNQDQAILNISQFSQQLLLKNPNASNFGLAMVESSPQVIFKANS